MNSQFTWVVGQFEHDPSRRSNHRNFPESIGDLVVKNNDGNLSKIRFKCHYLCHTEPFLQYTKRLLMKVNDLFPTWKPTWKPVGIPHVFPHGFPWDPLGPWEALPSCNAGFDCGRSAPRICCRRLREAAWGRVMFVGLRQLTIDISHLTLEYSRYIMMYHDRSFINMQKPQLSYIYHDRSIINPSSVT
jgi:hypothetical protein